MDYKKHYSLLITKAKNRIILPGQYYEKHHIIPKCVGGNDNKTNLVKLTPEEHYTAHLLLVKLYPNVDALVYAANKMTVSSKCTTRNNKRYGWLKRKYHQVCKKRTGHRNSSFGKPWYYNPATLEAKKFIINTQPAGWIKGRAPPYSTICIVCEAKTNSSKAKWCNNCRPKKQTTIQKSPRKKYYYTHDEKLQALKENNWHIRKALYSLGLSDSGYHYTSMKKIMRASMPSVFETEES